MQVVGLARMIMSQNLPVRLRVLVPAVENAIDGDAFRPGDVIVARSGKTSEIGNTGKLPRAVQRSRCSVVVVLRKAF